MNELTSESSGEEQAEVEEKPQDRRVSRLPIIHLMPRSKVGSPAGSPKISPKDSPRGSPRNSPLLFRKLMMNRSINLQRRRFTLAHTPRPQARGVGMVDRWLCPLMALLAGSMDPSQPEASVSGTAKQSQDAAVLHVGTPESLCCTKWNRAFVSIIANTCVDPT
ncbi:hypothetical protein GBF38_016347, partial [Nibea albiflora]